jgi:hypothetical protein
MKRLLYPFSLVFLFCVSLALLTTVFKSGFLQYLAPNLFVILLVWISLQRSFLLGGVLTLILAHFYEIFSGAPQGLILLIAMILFLFYHFLVKWVVIPNQKILVLWTMVGCFFFKLLHFIFLTRMVHHWHLATASLTSLIPETLIVGLLAEFCFEKLKMFDHWFQFETKIKFEDTSWLS